MHFFKNDFNLYQISEGSNFPFTFFLGNNGPPRYPPPKLTTMSAIETAPRPPIFLRTRKVPNAVTFPGQFSISSGFSSGRAFSFVLLVLCSVFPFAKRRLRSGPHSRVLCLGFKRNPFVFQHRLTRS